jgi:predicted polyphosphate/ATP-dependent NAD kinase
VGIIANPASGKDIRRLVAHGSVFSNQEKVNIVRRVLLGLDAMGVASVVTMPDDFQICRKAQASTRLRLHVQELDMPVFGQQIDTTRAAAMMHDMGVDGLISLGGDGTNRALAKACGSIPLLPLSTGTNNVFPIMMEGTLAGLAAGIIARHLVTAPGCVVRRPRLDILVQDDMVDLALVDAVVCTDTSIASRAVWQIDKVRCVVVAQRLPAQIGFMALAGNLPHAQDQDTATHHGMLIHLHPDAPPVLAPIAPGLIVPVGVQAHTPLPLGKRIDVATGPCMLALDGEREVTVRAGEQVAVHLNPEGPYVIDPQHVLAEAAQQGIFLQKQIP